MTPMTDLRERAARKTCSQCKETKPLESYHKAKWSKDGRKAECKACIKERGRKYRADRKANGLSNSGTRMPPEYFKEYNATKRDHERAREIKRRLGRKYRMEGRYKEQELASRKVCTAKESGKLVEQPCEICGENKTDAHHEDYSKPLEVRWLCRQHHTDLHAGKITLEDINE